MVSESFEHRRTQETLSILRVIYFDEPEKIDKLTLHKDNFKTWGFVRPLSNRNELKVLHELIKMI